MNLDGSPFLADAAATEVASREKWYPADIEAGLIERTDALNDITCWKAIHLALQAPIETERGATSPLWTLRIDIPWAALEHAVSRALIAQTERAAEKPGDQARAARRDAVQQIHSWVTYHRWFWTDLSQSRPPRLPAVPAALSLAA